MKPQPWNKTYRAGDHPGSPQKLDPRTQTPCLRLVDDMDEVLEAESTQADLFSPAKRIAAVIGVGFLLCALWGFLVFILYRLVRFAF